MKVKHVIEGRKIKIGDILVGGNEPLTLISGPCQLESLDHARMMAESIAKACSHTNTRFVFKASYDKANRSSISTKRGLGVDKGPSDGPNMVPIKHLPELLDTLCAYDVLSKKRSWLQLT